MPSSSQTIAYDTKSYAWRILTEVDGILYIHDTVVEGGEFE